jgi:aminoglycoside phosphotransferase (APT) family kinase protein
VDDSRTLWPANYAVLTKLEGIMLREAAPGLTPEQLRSVYREMGQMLRQIHEVHLDAFGYLGTCVLEPRSSNAEYMQAQFARKLGEYDRLGGDPAIRRAVEARVAAGAPALASCSKPSLCHNDFHDANVIVSATTGRLEGILDVENALAGDPLIDLAKTAIYPSAGTGPKLEGLHEGYGELPADAAARLHLYQLYHALELWVWVAARDPSTPWLAGVASDIERLSAAPGR